MRSAAIINTARYPTRDGSGGRDSSISRRTGGRRGNARGAARIVCGDEIINCFCNAKRKHPERGTAISMARENESYLQFRCIAERVGEHSPDRFDGRKKHIFINRNTNFRVVSSATRVLRAQDVSHLPI